MNLIPRESIFDLNRVFDDFFSPAAAQRGSREFFSPAVDVHENEQGYTVKLDLPGVKKEDVNVQLQDGLLTIEASHDAESSEEKDGKVIRKERRTGRFSRSFSVGKEISQSDVNAGFENGVLSITLPRVSETTPETRRVEIK
ncbi:MAG: Hsp20/alpha crystallin family protein [Gammaproteobacteria bacterium]|nr:Hsp20/alpha crystallin family protein [Gammaproteobacteria bacterium]MBT8150891.1 Hsp20/alpha crystallin family protein [Gammaproteobacteria bacterium]NND38483.1 Hsp20/alpha crystallin family protein [Pseudomonadales bacterium]NNL10888.1 Hsp20/alpha crystallin family protein [Pseudomonadales bacterium]NNM11559.1 Hsp20/alpha crystallin family protein [Pseudomonadales bacterium]